MRIDRLDLLAYGPFTGRTLLFESAQPDFHLVYGPNEAGKSCVLRAVLGLLFGIPGQTPDVFLHRGRDLRVGVTLTEEERPVRFIRRKGNKDTLLDEEGEPLLVDPLADFHQRVDRERFERFFGLNHAMLREGGEALLAGKGDVGRTLFEAAGYLGLRRLLQQLEEEAGAVFKPRAQNPSINLALSEYEAERKKSRQEAVPRERVQQLQLDLDQAASAIGAKRRQAQETQGELARLQRIRANKPDVVRLEGLRSELSELAGVPQLAPNAAARRQQQQNVIANAERQISQLKVRITRRNEELKTLSDFPLALLHAADIAELNQQTGRFRKDTGDLRQKRKEEDSSRGLAQAAWERGFPGHPLEEAQKHRALHDDRHAVREVITVHGKLIAVRNTHEASLADAQKQVTRLEDQLSQMPEPPDGRRLQAATKEARSRGPIESQRNQTLRGARSARSGTERALASLSPWQGTLEELEVLPVPLPATIERFTERWKATETDLQNARQRAREKAGEIQDCRASIQRGAVSNQIPTREEVAVARRGRDSLWTLIRSWVFDHVIDSQAVEAQLQPGEKLPDTFESATREADRRADVLLDNAEAAAQLKALSERLAALHAERRDLDQAVERLECEQGGVLTEWKACWPQLSGNLLPPQEMRQWIERRTRIIDQLVKTREHEEGAEALAGEIETHRNSISLAFAEILHPRAAEHETLGALLERADDALRSIMETGTARAAINEKLQAARQTEADSREKLKEVERQVSGWDRNWATAMARHNLDTGVSTNAVAELLSILEEVFEHLSKAADLRRRIEGMERDIQTFEETVARAVAQVDVSLSSLRADEAVAQLYGKVNQARHAEITRVKHAQENAEDQREIAERQDELEKAENALAGLRQQAGCSNDTELERVEREFERRQEVERQVRELESGLVQRNGEPVDEVLREAASIDIHTLQEQLVDHEQAASELSDQIEEEASRRGELRNQLHDLDESQASAEASQRAQEALERARQGVEDYLRLYLSAQILRRAMETYRQKNQAPIIERTSEIFRTLTLGEHQSLETDFDEHDKPVLMAVRQNGQKVPMEGLSDGTRDQLYLALRIAAIEQHVRQSGALPVILDDVLINSDDDRARATLGILSELAGKTQVLFFTHHSRLAEMAQECSAHLIMVGQRAMAAS